MDNILSNNLKNYKEQLVNALIPLMPESDTYNTDVENLVIVKRDSTTLSEVCLQQPVLIFSVQGEKCYTAGREKIVYHEGQVVLQSIAMPCSSYVVKATKDIPYIAMVLTIDMQIMSELIYSLNDVDISSITQPYSSLGIIEATEELVSSFLRLANLLHSENNDIKVLSPLIIKEIYYYLLKTPLKEKLISFSISSSQNNKILKTIYYLKQNYNKHFSINDLAKMVNMSPATFHRHFKMVTTLSPIQYQKSLRLLEAARMIQYENMTVSEVAFKVGYESISQFTREYKGMFNATPKNRQ